MGNTEQMPGVFSALMKDNYDAAVVIQDYPPKHIHEDNSPYRNDSQSFIKPVSFVAFRELFAAICRKIWIKNLVK